MQVKNLAGASAIAAGNHFTAALGTDGTVWTWGDNQYGQLCDGTTTTRTTPVRVVGPGGKGLFTAPRPGMSQIILSPSLAGGVNGDVLAVDGVGTLWRYPSSKSGALGKRVSLGTGWGGLTAYAPGDWNNDKKNDVLAVNAATGKMYLYPGNGAGGLGKGIQVGQGWGGFEVIPAGDLTGDGFADLLVIKQATGELFLYAGNGKGGFKYPYPKVGYGWTGYQLFAAGDLNRDGKSDVLSIDAKGNLFMYAGLGTGGFAKKIQVGNGWLGYQLAAGADLNGDGLADIVGRDATGRLFFYAAKGGGFFHKKTQIGTGW